MTVGRKRVAHLHVFANPLVVKCCRLGDFVRKHSEASVHGRQECRMYVCAPLTHFNAANACGLKSRKDANRSFASCKKRFHTCNANGPSRRFIYCSRKSNSVMSILRDEGQSVIHWIVMQTYRSTNAMAFFVRSDSPGVRHEMLSQSICTAFCALEVNTSTRSYAADVSALSGRACATRTSVTGVWGLASLYAPKPARANNRL